jgi:glycosyltransferase involved in cell wall biosynthesis
MYRIPLLTYLHTNYLPKSRFFSFAYASSCIVAVSEFALRPFRNDGYPNTRAMIIYNGVDDLAEVKPSKDIGLREELGIEPDEFLVMSLSALVDWKKVDLIIEAFKIVERAPGKRFVLVVVGDGPRLEALKELGRGHRIIFCGWRSDIANVMGSADCVAVASEKEAFALNILEAASMSIPVIGANAGGIREAIVDRETGFLVEPGSAQGFAKAILALQNDPNLCRAIGKKAREAFELKFRVQRMQSDMNGLINVLASKKEPIAPRFWRLFHLSAMLLVRLFLSKRVRK